MIASATLITAKNEDEETKEIEKRFIGLWQFDPSSYNPYGEEAWFFFRFNNDGTCSIYGTYDGNDFVNNGTWYVDDETNDLVMLSEQGSQTMSDYHFSNNFKTLTLNPTLKKRMRFNKIVLEVGPTEPIIIQPDPKDPQPIPEPEQPVPEPIPTDIVVMELGDTYHPGSVSGLCMVVGQIFYNCPCVTLELYIDGKLHSIQDKTIRSIWFEGVPYTGFLFDNWDTTRYENGLHQLKLVTENGDIVVEMLVIVNN